MNEDGGVDEGDVLAAFDRGRRKGDEVDVGARKIVLQPQLGIKAKDLVIRMLPEPPDKSPADHTATDDPYLHRHFLWVTHSL